MSLAHFVRIQNKAQGCSEGLISVLEDLRQHGCGLVELLSSVVMHGLDYYAENLIINNILTSVQAKIAFTVTVDFEAISDYLPGTFQRMLQARFPVAGTRVGSGVTEHVFLVSEEDVRMWSPQSEKEEMRDH